MSSYQLLSKFLYVTLLVLFSTAASAGLTVTYYHNDVTGSPVAATNAAGEVIWRKTYTPYGEASGKDRDNKVGYTGHQEDANGLVFAGARYYDPALGRFLGVDPVGFSEKNPMSFNRYAYANDNPYKYVDPDGRSPLLFLFLFTGVTGADIATAVGIGSLACITTNCGTKISDAISKYYNASDASETPDDGATDGSSGETTKETKTRPTQGGDGGTSEITIERDASGNAISKTHTVTTDGEVVHQHQDHIGKEGGERRFPNEWVEFPSVNAD